MAKKTSKKKYSRSAISTIIFVLIVVVLALAYYFLRPQLNKILSNRTNNADSSASTSVNQIIKQAKNDGDLKVHFISVGQADSIFIEFPTGDTMLIDAAEASSSDKVVSYVSSLDVKTIDYVLLTHQDADHAGGMEAVFKNFEVKNALRPAVYSKYTKYDLPADFNVGKSDSTSKASTTKTYYNYLKSIYEEPGCKWSVFNKDSDIIFTANDESGEYSYDCTLDFLTPTAAPEDIAYKKENNFSPIILLEYAGRKLLLTGDAEKEVEQELIAYYSGYDKDYFDVDFLKVGHHGSKTSSTENFISLIKPEYSIISCGLDSESQKYCPWQVTLDTLKDADSTVYRTDLQGNIVLTVSKDGTFRIQTERECNDYSLMLTGYAPTEP